MKLLSLVLHNFKGIKEQKIDFNGEDLVIYGDNATGKTTIADAFFWLLFDKDSQNKKQFEIKTLDKDGKAIPKLDHSVDGVFETENGKTIKLKKVYAEKYTKKRGQARADFTGHTTDYYINDAPKKKNEFVAKVGELTADEKKFQLLTSPYFFPEKMSWQDQRDLILEVCGDINDADVIASDPDLAELPALMEDKTLDEFKAMVQGQKRDANKKLEGIPARVDEATRAIPDLTVKNAQPIIAKLKTLNEKLEIKKEEISSLKSCGGVEQKKLELVNLDTAIGEARNKHNAGADTEAIEEKRKELRKIRNDIDDLDRSIKTKEQDLAMCKMSIVDANDKIVDTLANWKQVKARQYSGDNTCPTCSQSLPEDQIQSAIAKFNENKANELEKIVERGNATKAKKESFENLISKTEIELTTDRKTLSEWQEQSKEIQGTIKSLTEDAPTFEETPEHKQLMEDRAKIEEEIKSIQDGNSQGAEKAVAEKEALEAEIKENNDLISAINLTQRQQDRIAELEEEEKALSAEYEKLESWLFLIESFIKAKVSMLESKINSKFEVVTFKLFNEQINEGIKETCEVMINGVPYGSLNSAARVHAGLDIIKTLSEYYNFTPPIFIDNRESVTSLPEMKAQVVSLVVSGEDTAMRIRQAETAKAA